MRKPQPAPELPEDVAEVLHDALEGRHRSAESYEEDVRDAFQALPKANIEAAAAVCHDMGNEAMKSERYQEAVDHYTSVLAAHPHDHEVLANRSLAYLHLRQGPEALQDAALCVNLKPNWAKGYYRMGCALEECKAYKEAASVFAKVVEMEPENAEARGRGAGPWKKPWRFHKWCSPILFDCPDGNRKCKFCICMRRFRSSLECVSVFWRALFGVLGAECIWQIGTL